MNDLRNFLNGRQAIMPEADEAELSCVARSAAGLSIAGRLGDVFLHDDPADARIPVR